MTQQATWLEGAETILFWPSLNFRPQLRLLPDGVEPLATSSRALRHGTVVPQDRWLTHLTGGFTKHYEVIYGRKVRALIHYFSLTRAHDAASLHRHGLKNLQFKGAGG